MLTPVYSIPTIRPCGGCPTRALEQKQTRVHATPLAGGNLSAPVCADCRNAHEGSPKTACDTCVGCHLPGMEAHRKWPPNTGLHPELQACPALSRAGCAAPRVMELRLHGCAATKWNSEKQGRPEFEIMARRKKRRKPRLFHDSTCPATIIMCTWRRNATEAEGNGLDAMQPPIGQQRRAAARFRYPMYQPSRNRGFVPCLIEIKLTHE